MILDRGLRAQGEFTVVALIGHLTDITPADPISPESLLVEFGEMTLSGAISRREAINRLAARHRIAPNELYAAIELAKKSVT